MISLQKSYTSCPLLSPSPDRGVAVWGNPHTRKVVCIDLVLDELASALLVHVDAARLSVMDLAAHYCRVSIRLHLETCYPVPVDVAALEVALQREPESHETHTSTELHQC